jgi:putative DNA primase/helicase
MSPSAKIVRAYDYRDEFGTLLYQVLRYDPKDFKQRCPNGHGGWLWSLKGVRRVPYRLPELLAAPKDRPVYLVEGEKDADTLAEFGLVATTLAGGANTTWTKELAEPLAGRTVILVPDNDDPGRAYMRWAADSLKAVGAEVGWLELPGLPEKGDVSDWFAQDPRRCLADFLKLPLGDVPAANGRAGGVSPLILERQELGGSRFKVTRIFALTGHL